jgi:hypothetical protein
MSASDENASCTIQSAPKQPRGWLTWLILLSGFSVLTLWYFALRPRWQIIDADWLDDHTEHHAWVLEREVFHRLPLPPSSLTGSGRIDRYGGKEEFAKIVESKGSYGVIGFCECCVCSALCEISNHNLPSLSDYKAWYADHSHESQLEWVKQGFIKAGIPVAEAGEAANVATMLDVLGAKAKGPPRPSYFRRSQWKYADYLRYNAFRWLRDTGFEPLDWLRVPLSLTLSSTKERGLQEYLQFDRHHPKALNVGRLSKDYDPSRWPHGFRPAGPGLVGYVFPLCGLTMVVWATWSLRRRYRGLLS